MQTKIFEPTAKNLQNAGKIIRDGGLVAFPTETVYGIGTNGLNEDACRKIFSAKVRPNEKALSLHVADLETVERVAEISPLAEKLFKNFCPGPLTIILPKKNIVPDFVTGGFHTVGIRFPDNKIALDLIKNSGCPVAASSANISGSPPPKTAEEVYKNLTGKVEMIIDGGECKIGVSSTVIDVSTGELKILRLGSISLEEIKRRLKE